MGAVPAPAPALSHAEGFDFSEDADDIALRQADAAKDLEQPVKQMPFSQFVDQCQATLQKELQQKIRGNEDTLIAHAKIRAAYINIDQACDATRWAKEANISNASRVPGLGLYIDLYQGVLKKPERLARALHEKHFFYHLYRYRQLMQWYNEAGKKHETGLENLPQQFLSLISTISKVKVQSPVGRVGLLKDLPVWGICAVGTAQEIDRTAQQLSRYCLPSSAARDLGRHSSMTLDHKAEREAVGQAALSQIVAPQHTISAEWQDKIVQANAPYTRQCLIC